MTPSDKKDRFKAIAQELITKEYLGIVEYGKDPEYEKELTDAATDYLISVFTNTQDLCTNKETLLNIMNRRDIKYKSNILKVML